MDTTSKPQFAIDPAKLRLKAATTEAGLYTGIVTATDVHPAIQEQFVPAAFRGVREVRFQEFA